MEAYKTRSPALSMMNTAGSTCIFFADDAAQRSPSRPGMGQLSAVGGILIASTVLSELERRLDRVCTLAGFPQGEPFKWSPSRSMWMWANLTGAARATFFSTVTATLAELEAVATVVVTDPTRASATGADSADQDAVALLIERVHCQCTRRKGTGLLIVARPGGGRQQEDALLEHCRAVVTSGTSYVRPDNVSPTISTTPLAMSRALQAADVVVSCTLAMVAGETRFAPGVFTEILPLFDKQQSRIGGVGLKLHPDYCFANLYHWILGDVEFCKRGICTSLPSPRFPYYEGPFSP